MQPRTPLIAPLFAACLCLFTTPISAAPPKPVKHAPPPAESAFLAENAMAMDRMMVAMDAKPTGDVDRDFVAMMAPHHQGAIDMAQLVLRYGKNEQIRRLAQEIIVTQQQEIAAMYLAIGEPLPPQSPAPTQPADATPHHHSPQTAGP